jgi:hypothetical protein
MHHAPKYKLSVVHIHRDHILRPELAFQLTTGFSMRGWMARWSGQAPNAQRNRPWQAERVNDFADAVAIEPGGVNASNLSRS